MKIGVSVEQKERKMTGEPAILRSYASTLLRFLLLPLIPLRADRLSWLHDSAGGERVRRRRQ
jgi:hypothetical protein